jgi:hypothetical protein
MLVSACGMSVHTEVAMQAMRRFGRPDVNVDVGALQAGAPSPDWFYFCDAATGRVNNSLGEEMHWPPWQMRFIENNSITMHDRVAVSFLMGAVSHMIADVIAHGIHKYPFGYGLIRTLGGVNFECGGSLCSIAHTRVDVGAEFILASQVSLESFDPVHWQVPRSDVEAAFVHGTRDVTTTNIEACEMVFASGIEAMKAGGSLWAKHWSTGASFLQYHLWEHLMGGIDDMTIWTGRVWTRLDAWIEHGVPPTPPPDFYSAARARPAYALPLNFPSWYKYDATRALPAHPCDDRYGKSITRWSDGVWVGAYGAGTNMQGRVCRANSEYCFGPSGESDFYGRFGWSMVTWGSVLAVGAPTSGWNTNGTTVIPEWRYEGAVYLYDDVSAAPVILGTGRDLDFFGMNLASNSKSVYLVVGSPYALVGTHGVQNGRVWVYGPNATLTHAVSGGEDGAFEWLGCAVGVSPEGTYVAWASRSSVFVYRPDVSMTTAFMQINNTAYGNRTEYVTSIAFNGNESEIAIGIPDQGRVEVYEVKKSGGETASKVLSGDWYSRYGQRVVWSSEEWVVSAPLGDPNEDGGRPGDALYSDDDDKRVFYGDPFKCKIMYD